MPGLEAIAPIIWARWGGKFLETLRETCLDAPDGLAFEAMNSDFGVRRLLVACTTNRQQIETISQALSVGAGVRTVDWEKYSVAEMLFRAEKKGGLAHQATLGADGNRTCLAVCATRPEAVRTVEKLFELPE